MTAADRQGLRRLSAARGMLVRSLAGTGRGRKQAVSAVVDASLVVVALWLAYSLRHGVAFDEFRATWYLFVLVPIATVVLFASLGIYRWVVRSSNRRLYRELVKGCVLSALCLVLITFLLPPDRMNPRSLFIIFGALLVLGTCGSRVLWQGLLDEDGRGEPIAIYGAGAAGRQLASLLSMGAEYRPVTFIDDRRSLSGSTVSGLPVLFGKLEVEELRGLLRQLEVERVVLAMPSVSDAKYRRMLERLERLELPIQTMPRIAELVAGDARPDEIRDVSIRDILGRMEVAPDSEFLRRRVTGRTVLVTGGGGSIGSELCRQIARLAPRRLIVLDSCEANLYHMTEELRIGDLALTPVLGSVNDRKCVDRLMSCHRVDTVYHAAAYKHVPIVEAQPEQGVRTNVFGTLTLLDTALAHKVSDFVLISTDKAVRPANAMGASKRTAEMILQAKAHDERNGSTCISMVRFGNVLGSSGSVVPKFKKQIQAGGPITVTHPDITRYFMTIPEAAQLVLQASAIARGGDVFVLDMGEPVRILELAKTMVRLYGKRLAEESGDPRDVAIEFKGLRPGEKMYEELFITRGHRATAVRKVFTANETWLPWDELRARLDTLSRAMKQDEDADLRTELMSLALAAYCDRQEPDFDETLHSTAEADDRRAVQAPAV